MLDMAEGMQGFLRGLRPEMQMGVPNFVKFPSGKDENGASNSKPC